MPEKTTPWPAPHAVRRAGVTAIGMGGTNAQVIVEQPPPVVPTARNGGNPALVLSGRTPDAVRAAARRLAAHLAAHPKLSLADVAHTLRVGRCAFGYRTTVTAGVLNGELVIEQVPPDEPPETLPHGRRVSLPGYPFVGERLWIDTPGMVRTRPNSTIR